MLLDVAGVPVTADLQRACEHEQEYPRRRLKHRRMKQALHCREILGEKRYPEVCGGECERRKVATSVAARARPWAVLHPKWRRQHTSHRTRGNSHRRDEKARKRLKMKNLHVFYSRHGCYGDLSVTGVSDSGALLPVLHQDGPLPPE